MRINRSTASTGTLTATVTATTVTTGSLPDVTPSVTLPEIDLGFSPAELHALPVYSDEGAPRFQSEIKFDFTPKKGPGDASCPAEFLRTKNTFTTLSEHRFFQYAMHVAPEGSHLFRILTPPPLLREGFVCHEKNVYFVTLEDLRRNVVRKSRQLSFAPRRLTIEDFENGTTASRAYELAAEQLAKRRSSSDGSNTDAATGDGEAPPPSGTKSRGNPKSKSSDSKGIVFEAEDSDFLSLADGVFTEQAVTLLRSQNPKEGEWEWETIEV